MTMMTKATTMGTGRPVPPVITACSATGAGTALPYGWDALNAGYRFLEVRCLGCDTSQTVDLTIIRCPKETTPVHELERYLLCKDCSQMRGSPYKRSCPVALRLMLISALDPPSIWRPGER